MIKAWKHKGLKVFFETGSSRGINAQHADRVRRLLDRLDAASCVEEMNLPSFDLHELKGERKGTWAVKVSGNWRITFAFQGEDAHHVNLEDYH